MKAFSWRFGAAALLWLALAFLPTSAIAQTYTAVTGTITDPNGLPYSNAQITFQLTPHQGQATVTPCPNSPCPVPNPGSVQTNGAGAFSTTLLANGSILPSGTQWIVGVVEPGVALPWGTGPQQFSLTVTISGASQSLSASLSALAPALTFPFAPSGAVSNVTGTLPIVVTPTGTVRAVSCPNCVRTDPPAAQNINATSSNFPLSVTTSGSPADSFHELLDAELSAPTSMSGSIWAASNAELIIPSTTTSITSEENVGALDFVALTENSTNGQIFAGALITSSQGGTGNLTGGLYGGYFEAENFGTGTTTNAIGIDAFAGNVADGIVTNAIGLRVENPSQGVGAGTLTNTYGIYIESQTLAGSGQTNTPYGIYEQGATEHNLLGNLVIGAIATSPSPAPICPNGTGGMLTQAGCTSGTVNAALITTTLSANIPPTGTNPGSSPVTVASVSVPSADFAACATNGCRLRISYNYEIAGGTNGICYVSDGTNNYLQSIANTSANFTPCAAGAALSPTQFSAGANPTVTVTLYDLGTTQVCQFTSLTPPNATCPASGIAGQVQIEVVQSK